MKKIFEEQGFVGFAGIESAKFRSIIEPGQKLYMLGHITKYKRRKHTSHVTTAVQGVVDGALVFEATVSGMRI